MSKPIGLSRGPGIDTELCVENVGSGRFDLVLIATARAREIRRQHRESDKREHIFPIVTALQEIQEGKIGKEYLSKVR
jgi:DNA-directed RNA polymerase omega subunit